MKVLVDGQPLPDAEARAVWQRFSGWMDEHRGDLAGFAAREGWKSVHPGVEGGSPVLLASHEDVQRPYGPAGDQGSPSKGGGSRRRHAVARGHRGSPESSKKKPR